MILFKSDFGLKFDIFFIMKTKKYLSQIFNNKMKDKKKLSGINNTAKVFAVSVLALFALGVFTTSQRLNAG